MKQQIRHGVFETNSSTAHTLTLKKNNREISEDGRIPSNTVFEFENSMVQDFGYHGKNAVTEIEKLALCIAYCFTKYELIKAKETKERWCWWEWREEAESLGLYNSDEGHNEDEPCYKEWIKNLWINDLVKNKPCFSELYNVIKKIRNTDLVLTDALYELDSLNDFDAFENFEQNYFITFGKYPENDFEEFFENVIFNDEYYVDDEIFPM